MSIREELVKAKEIHRGEMEDYSTQVREFVEEFGSPRCEYLNFRIEMSNYHRGAYNALVKLERIL